MEIGNQIKALRSRRGITQEAMAQHLGVTPQAVSKWERNVATPDIAMLPDISTLFGVTIDELFALSDETKIERIESMLTDRRFLDPAEAEDARRFLLEKARREPENADPHCILAWLELHQAQEHRARAEEYALEIMSRCPEHDPGFMYLAKAMGGVHTEWRFNTHNALIDRLKSHISEHPDCEDAWEWLICQLIADRRFEAAREYCDRMDERYGSPRYNCRIKLAIAEGDMVSAEAMLQKMTDGNPDNWIAWQYSGDLLTQMGRYNEARESYRRAISLQTAPHHNDAVAGLAICCEIAGDIPGAIEARKLELEFCKEDWKSTTGESVDFLRREIARLEKKL